MGATTSLALAAVDLALWDLRCLASGLPLWLAAGGAKPSVLVYNTEGGWLHLGVDELVADALRAKAAGWRGVKITIGKPDPWEDRTRLAAVREAVGPEMCIMLDANQSRTAAEAARRARLLEPFDPYWLEEPLPAEDIGGHEILARQTTIPIAVGESLYSPSHFREYLARGVAGMVQPDVARIGGVTPWLRVAHLADTFNVRVAPHFSMEIRVSLSAAVPNGLWVEHIPQLGPVVTSGLEIENGNARAPDAPGIGTPWNAAKLEALAEHPA